MLIFIVVVAFDSLCHMNMMVMMMMMMMMVVVVVASVKFFHPLSPVQVGEESPLLFRPSRFYSVPQFCSFCSLTVLFFPPIALPHPFLSFRQHPLLSTSRRLEARWSPVVECGRISSRNWIFGVFPVTIVINIRKRKFLVKYDLSDNLLGQLCKKYNDIVCYTVSVFLA